MERYFTPEGGPVQISAEQIATRIAELGAQITRDYAGKDLHVICVLNGAFMFTADLVRSIELPLTIDFLAVSSYGGGTETSGEVRLVKDLSSSLRGRHILVVEDIVDTGLTLHYLLGYLSNHEPASLQSASLLSKPARRRVEVPVEYVGFTIDDAFVIGYGLDDNEKARNLPYVTSKHG